MGRKEDKEENEERPMADGEAGLWLLQVRCTVTAAPPSCPIPMPRSCRKGSFLPGWMLQLTSLFENLKLPDHRRKVSLGILLSLPIAYKALILPKTPPAVRSKATPKTQSGSGGTATSLGLNAFPRNGVDNGKSCRGIL